MRPGMIEKIVLLYVKGCVVQFRQLFKIRYSRAYDFRSIFHVSYTLICWKIYFFLVSFLSDSFQWAKVTFQKEFLAVLASRLLHVVSYTKKISCTTKVSELHMVQILLLSRKHLHSSFYMMNSKVPMIL